MDLGATQASTLNRSTASAAYPPSLASPTSPPHLSSTTVSAFGSPALSGQVSVPSGSIRAPRQDAEEANHPVTQRKLDRSVTGHSEAEWQSASRQAHPPLVAEPHGDEPTVEGGQVVVPPTQTAVSNICMDTARHASKVIPHELTGEYPITDFDGKVHFKPQACTIPVGCDELACNIRENVPTATCGLVKGYKRSQPLLQSETTAEAAALARGYFPGEYRKEAGVEYVAACCDAEERCEMRSAIIAEHAPPPPPEAAQWVSTSRCEHNAALPHFVIREDVVRSEGAVRKPKKVTDPAAGSPAGAGSPRSVSEEELRSMSMQTMKSTTVDARRGHQAETSSPVRALKARLGERAMVSMWSSEYRDTYAMTEEEFAIAQRAYETTDGANPAFDRSREEIEAHTVAEGRSLGAMAEQVGSVRAGAPDHHTHYTRALVAPAPAGADTAAVAGANRVPHDARTQSAGGASGGVRLPALGAAGSGKSRGFAAGIGRRILEASMPRDAKAYAAQFAPRSFVRDKMADRSVGGRNLFSSQSDRRAATSPAPASVSLSASAVSPREALQSLHSSAAAARLLPSETAPTGPMAASGRKVDGAAPTGSQYGRIFAPFDSSHGAAAAPPSLSYTGAHVRGRGNVVSGVAAAQRADAAAAGYDEFADTAPLYASRADAEADREAVDGADTFSTTQRESYVCVSAPPAEHRKSNIFVVKHARRQMKHLHQPQRLVYNTTSACPPAELVPDHYLAHSARTFRGPPVDTSVPVV